MSGTDGKLPAPDRAGDPTASAKVLVLLLAFGWGFNWIFTRMALAELSPWALRFVGVGGGAATLFVIAWIGRTSLRIPRGQRRHILIAATFNVAAFNILSATAQIGGTTSRAIIIAYSMPIWAALLARPVLGERLTLVRLTALVLCAGGLAVLVWPLTAGGVPVSALFALGCALVWAAGTVHLKWANIDAAPIAVAGWQLLLGWVLITLGMLVLEGVPQLWPLHARTIGALAYNGLIGLGLSYFLWFTIIDRLPAMTASLGSLLVPVVGVIASTVMLGEHPTLNDIIGFALIFSAAACVLLQPTARHTELPE